MAEDGIEKVLLGKTSFAELQRVVDLASGRHTIAQEDAKETEADKDFLSHIV